MVYTILQLPVCSENCFRPFSKESFYIHEYVAVWRGTDLGDIDDSQHLEFLENLYAALNSSETTPVNYAGRSLSVSDIVIISPTDCFNDGRAYYCDPCSWVDITEFALK